MNLKVHILVLFFCIIHFGCSDFFSAQQQVFECLKTSLDGEPLAKPYKEKRYFHFNDERLNVSVGAVGVGLAEYQCKKSEFVYHQEKRMHVSKRTNDLQGEKFCFPSGEKFSHSSQTQRPII